MSDAHKLIPQTQCRHTLLNTNSIRPHTLPMSEKIKNNFSLEIHDFIANKRLQSDRI